MAEALTRAELAPRLGISIASVDRLITGGLQACAQRGRAKLYREADARRVMATAAKAGARTEYGGALVRLFGAQAGEARAREAELRAEFIQDGDWIPGVRAEVATVQRVLDTWVNTAARRIVEIMTPGGPRLFPGEDRRAVAYALLTFVAAPLWELLAAAIGERTPAPSTAPASVAPASTLPDAKRLLVDARAGVAALRADLKTDTAWRPRRAVEFALSDARARAKAALLVGLPGQCLREGADRAEAVARQAAHDVISTMEEPITRPPARRRTA